MRRSLILLAALLLPASLWLGNGRDSASGAATATPTFNKEIAPIIFNNCASCHRPGEVAPFSLLGYADVKRRAKQIADITARKIMPPWKADHSDYPLKDERRLTPAEIALINQWVAAGAIEGNPKDLPPLPKFTEGWQLGKPDLVVKMSEAFAVPADGPDIYRNFALPLNLPEDRWVRAIEFRPGTRSIVHHSLFFYDATGNARRQDEADPKPGYSGGMGGLAGGFSNTLGRGPAGAGEAAPIGSLGGWAVGARARLLPEGLAWRLPKGADLILSTHFHPSGKAESESSTVGLYFTDRPPAQKFTGIQLPPLFGVFTGLDIPAGAKEYTIEDSFELPVDVRAFGIGAHAHYLGREMKFTATLPSGQTQTLLWIRDWDFSWQDQYQFREFVPLPRGTRLHVKITYDNSAENPRNPTSPPKRVHWGEGSTDEMGSMSLAVVAAREADLPALQQATRQHLRESFMNRAARGRAGRLRRDR
ncbi:MAG: cytochrome c [Blastocatellia bacterium]|nr:cytochrome c [Blastocatellia bacterium]